MLEPKDVNVDIELSAEECAHLVMGMHQVISNHIHFMEEYSKMHPSEIGEKEFHDTVRGYEALRDKLKKHLNEVGY